MPQLLREIPLKSLQVRTMAMVVVVVVVTRRWSCCPTNTHVQALVLSLCCSRRNRASEASWARRSSACWEGPCTLLISHRGAYLCVLCNTSTFQRARPWTIRYSEAELRLKLGDETGTWVWRVCHGVDDSAVTVISKVRVVYCAVSDDFFTALVLP